MRALSLFSGAAGFEIGLHAAGIVTVAQAEIDKGACRILDRRFPDLPNLGDVRDIDKEALRKLPAIDLVVGGFPCQDLSVAGKRAGIHEGERSSLWFEMLRIFDASGATWLLAENVPGLLSGRDDDDRADEGVSGRDPMEHGPGGPVRSWFGALLRSLAERGLQYSWRVLDARHLGVPQRRRRVFILARRPGDGPHPGEVLAVGSGVRRDPAPGGASWPEVADTLGVGANQTCGFLGELAPVVGGQGIPDPAYCLADGAGTRPGSGRDGQDTFVIGPLMAHAQRHGHAMTTQQAAEAGHIVVNGDPTPKVAVDEAQALRAEPGGLGQAVVPSISGFGGYTEAEPCLRATGGDMGGGSEALMSVPGTVRRLTPVECERLMGWPDGWTCTCAATDVGPVPNWRGWDVCSCSDSGRYRACGNGVASPCAEWIGRRLMESTSAGTATLDAVDLYLGDSDNVSFGDAQDVSPRIRCPLEHVRHLTGPFCGGCGGITGDCKCCGPKEAEE